MFRVLTVSLVLLLAAFQGGCLKGKQKALSPEQQEIEDARETDRDCEEMLAEKGKVFEAREWLKQPNHMTAEMEKKDVVRVVDGLYAVGAVAIHVHDPIKTKRHREASTLIITLPADAAKRKAIFAYYNKELNAGAPPEDLEKDLGQKYILMDTAD